MTKSTADICFDHVNDPPQKSFVRTFKDGQSFAVVIANTAEACFLYDVEPVRVEKALESGVSLKAKTLSVTHDRQYGGYIINIRRRSREFDCGKDQIGAPKDATLMILADTDSWEVRVGGGFTGSGLTNPVYAVRKDEQATNILIENPDVRDDLSLGVGSFLHVYRKNWKRVIPSVTFGLGISESKNPTYYLGPFWRLGDQAFLGGGVAFGPVDSLPPELRLGDEVSDANALNQLPKRVDTQWFFGMTFTFLGGKEPFEKPFKTGAGSQPSQAETPSAQAARPVVKVTLPAATTPVGTVKVEGVVENAGGATGVKIELLAPEDAQALQTQNVTLANGAFSAEMNVTSPGVYLLRFEVTGPSGQPGPTHTHQFEAK
jgi:hypothetical protein